MKELPVKCSYAATLFLKQDYTVKVCRIEPENNIHLVLDAFKKSTKMNLVLVGNCYNNDYGKQLKES